MTAKNDEEFRGEAPGALLPDERRFGEFALDLRGRALYRRGERLHLTPKPFDTLALLVEGRGRTVSKRELLETVWAETAVTDDVLVQAIREIRRVLGDDKDAPRFVLTVPREGYRFVGALESELVSAAASSRKPPDPGTSPPPMPRTSRLAPLAAIGVLAAGVAIWLWQREPSATPRSRAEPADPTGLRQLTTGPSSAVKPTFSPDGRYVAYAASTTETEGALDLYISSLDGETELRITRGFDPAGDHPTFTPDGSHLVFSRYRSGVEGSRLPDLWIVPVLGGQPRIYLPEASGARFSPDGRRIAYTKHSGSQRPLRISPVGHPEEHVEPSDFGFLPRWSPDGKWLAYSSGDPNEGEGHLMLVSTSMSERRQLTAEANIGYGLAWSADSQSLIAPLRQKGTSQLWQFPISGGPPRAVTTGVGGYSSPDVSPDGRMLVFANGDGGLNLRIAEPPGSADLRRITDNENHASPRFSPSGRLLASVRRRSPEDTLIVTDLSTGSSRKAVDGVAQFPCWIDEGSIAYLAPRAAPEATLVWILRLDTGESRPWTEFEGSATGLDVLPGRERIAVILRREDHTERVVVRDFRQRRDVVVAEGARYDSLRWLPDGSALSWSGPIVSSDSRSSGIWIARLGPGASAPERILADGTGPVWSADGRSFVFSRTGPEAGLWRHDRASGKSAQVRQWVRVFGHDLWADRRLVFLKETSSLSRIYVMPLSSSAASSGKSR